MKEYAHGVHADALGPAELHIDALRIERIGLPHFQLVDCRGRDVVRAYQPPLLCVPVARLRLGPTLRVYGQGSKAKECQDE